MVVGCQLEQGDDDAPEPPVEKTVWQELATPRIFPIAATSADGGSVARAQGIISHGSEPSRSVDIDLNILGGQVTLWSTRQGYLVVQHLEVDFDDVSLGSDILPPSGVDLTGLQARVDVPAAALPDSQTDRVVAVVELDLYMEWAIRRDGQIYPMAPVRLEDVAVSIEVYRLSTGQLATRLVAVREGVFWSWADTFELAELMVDLVSPVGIVE